MEFTITITEVAETHFDSLSARDQRTLKAAIQSRLRHQPTSTSNAIKKLRPNSLAEFELRAGNLRVLYNVEGDQVIILVVGKKQGNKLLVAGKEYHGHQDHPTEPTGNGTAKNPE